MINFTPTKLKKVCKRVFLGLLIFFITVTTFNLLKRPSHDRDWRADNKHLTKVDFQGETVSFSHVRDWRYDPDGPTSQEWVPKSYDLSKLENTWFIMEPFSNWEGVGHAIMMFDFSDGETVLVSVEARKEVGEVFSAWKGIWREFELIYLWGTPEDFLVRRSIVQKHPLRMHRLKIQKSTQINLFRALVKKTNDLADNPQFYHTLLNNCTNELAYATNDAKAGSMPFSLSRFLTGYADKTLFDRGLIHQGKSWEAHVANAYVHDFISENYHAPDWLDQIRNHLTESEK